MRIDLLPEDGQFYKVNLHSHTTLSDGKQTPEEVKEAYKSHGYAAVAFTEHEALHDVQYLTDKDFIAINAYEYGFVDREKSGVPYYDGAPIDPIAHSQHVHLNFYAKRPDNLTMVCFNPQYVRPYVLRVLDKLKYDGDGKYVRYPCEVDSVNDVIRQAKEHGFYVTYNHPHWSLNTYPLYSGLKGVDALEIINGGSNLTSDMDVTPHVYDEMLRMGMRLDCVAGDDNHDVSKFFRAWTMVKAPELSYAALMDAIERGDMYASEGPSIEELYYEDGKVYVRCSEAAGVYLTTIGRRKECVLAELIGKPVTEAVLPVREEDVWFRVSVRDAAGKHAYSRCFYVEDLKKGNP